VGSGDEEDDVSLPPLPNTRDGGDGYDFMDRLSGGWYVVPQWGSDGWNLGNWPYQIIVHYDNEKENVYGWASYTEGDLDIKEVSSRKARNELSNQYFVWFWNHQRAIPGAPHDLDDRRLGPYWMT
jgi:hypothetical protein